MIAAAGLTLLVALSAEPTAAMDLESLQQLLDETVITGASKNAESSTVAPATVTVITAEDLNRYGIHSLDDALNFLSLGMVTQNPLHSVDVGARGVMLTADFGNHVLLLLNGHVLNEQWDGTAYFERGAAIPWELIDHIEVILGPGSVLYGSNAMLGVINVVTRRAKDYGKGVFTIDADASAPVDGNANVRGPNGNYFGDAGGGVRVAAGGGHSFQLFGREAQIVGQVEYYTAKGPAFTFGPQAYGDDSVTGTAKNFGPNAVPGVWGGVAHHSYATRIPAGHLRFSVGELNIELRAATYWRSTPYLNQFNQFYGDFDNPHNGELDRFLNLDIRYRVPLTRWLTFSVRGYGALYDFDQQLRVSAAEDCVEGQVDGCLRGTKGYSRWLGLEVQGKADWASDGRWLTLLGADGRLRHVGGNTTSTAVGSSTPEVFGAYGQNESVLGIYLQQEAHPLRWLSLNAGARLDLDSRFGSRVSPRAAVSFRATDTTTVKLVYSEAFRAPTAYELYYSDPTGQIAATGLRPETVRSFEGSIEQRFGLQRILLGGFWSRWSQMTLQDEATQEEIDVAVAAGTLQPGATAVVLYRNVSSLDNFGGNLSFDGSAAERRLRYGATLTLAQTLRRSDIDGSTLPLTVTPQLFGNARVSYDLGGTAPTLALAAYFAGSRPVDRAFDGEWATLPYAPPQVQVRATVSGPFPWVRGLSYRASIDYNFTGRSAYVAGPFQAATPEFVRPELAPMERLRLNLQILEKLF